MDLPPTPISRLRKRKRPDGDVKFVAATVTKKAPTRRRNAKPAASPAPPAWAETLEIPTAPVRVDRSSPAPDAGRESALCDVCRSVLDKYELVEDLRTIAVTSEDLEERVGLGCRLCALFLSLMTEEQRRKLQRQERRHELEYIKSRDMQSDGVSSQRLILSSGDLADPDSISWDVLLVPVGGTLDEKSHQIPYEKSTASEQSIRVARKWLEECSTQHTCRKRSDQFVPTRLIDVGTGSTPEPRLCLGKELPSDRHYLTLSHCWGRTVPTRLLKDNVASMMEHIEYDELPKTFQQAVSVTHRLGERYLWIDSLCIIQDSLDDWQNESSVMSSVYSYSWCNISATFAMDGSEGLFVEREPEIIEQIRVWVGRDLRTPMLSYAVDPDFWRKEVTDAPLSQRAWVCQERLLSPCNLHFCSNQLIWECRCHVACETFPKGLPADFRQASSSVYGSSIKMEAGEVIGTSLAKHETNDKTAGKVYEMWKAIVNLYTTTSLSHETDKLVAIGGLASSLETSLDDRYLAGLWANDLPKQLLWTALGAGSRHTSSEYIAPTWSWASVNSGVTFSHPYSGRSYTTALVDIVDSRVTHITERNHFGQISGASLSLKGNLAQASLPPHSSDIFDSLNIHESPTSASTTTLDANVPPPNAAPAVVPAAHVVWDSLSEADLRQISAADGSNKDDFFLLPVLMFGGSQREAGSQREEDVVVGIVLRPTKTPTETMSKDIFRREGWFSYGMGIVDEDEDGDGAAGRRVMDGCRYFDQSRGGEMGLVREGGGEGEGAFRYIIRIV